MTESGMDKEESDDELSLGHGRRDSSDSLKSINLAASVESVHVTFPEQQTAVRRKRSSSNSEPSQRSSFSSNRSQRGSCQHNVSRLQLGPRWPHFSRACGSGARECTGCYEETDVVMRKEKGFEIRETRVQILPQLCHPITRNTLLYLRTEVSDNCEKWPAHCLVPDKRQAHDNFCYMRKICRACPECCQSHCIF